MLLRLLNYLPEAVRAEPVVEPAATSGVGLLDPARPFTVATWNLQYCGTRRHHFFYDGGPDTFPDPANVQDALTAIRETLDGLRQDGLDVALLQEVDRGSARTGLIDQLQRIAEGWPTWVSTPYHRSVFVPHPMPPRRPLGRVDLHEAILSRFKLGATRRLALPSLVESPVRQAFNLHRALLITTMPLLDGRRLHLGVTHLSAFSKGDGTLQRQIDAIRAWIASCADEPFVLGGDFNLLPPGDNPARLGAEAVEYAEDVLGSLSDVAQRAPLLGEHTYLPPGASVPDRTLDHLLFSPQLTLCRHRVVEVPAWLSDHWPLVATFEFAKR